MSRLLPLMGNGSSAYTAAELYHYRCKNTLGGQSPINLHGKLYITKMRQLG